jgi:hypothetical protein
MRRRRDTDQPFFTVVVVVGVVGVVGAAQLVASLQRYVA